MVYCGECKQECKALELDDGVGSYECHGFCGTDSRPYLASDCCEAPVFEDEECTREYTGDDF